MRRIGLVILGSLAAACGGPGTESSNVAAQQQEETASVNETITAAQVAPDADAEASNATSTAEADSANPCSIQGANRLQVAPIRAVGTEPFWGARVEGRCVTYSTPENQTGVRVWTRYSMAADGTATWAGQLEGRIFELRVRSDQGCSDGMSDQRYPLAAELTVNGEQRRGCAIPL